MFLIYVGRGNSHLLLKYLFGISINPLKVAPKRSISYLQPILAAIFVTIATVKVKENLDLYTLVIVLIN